MYLLTDNVKADAEPFSKDFVEEPRKIDDLKGQGYLRPEESTVGEVHEASKVISKEAADDTGAKLLMTVPGVPFYSALLIASEAGGVNRFPDSDSLAASESDARQRQGVQSGELG